MRLPVPRSRGSASASLAVLTAAALLAGCGVSGNSPGPPAPPSSTSAKPSPSPSPTWNPSGAIDTVAAVGDSITRGFDACSVLNDCPKVSWATGTDSRVNSFAARLRPGAERSRTRPPRGTAVPGSWNLARSGARAKDLPAQVTRAVRKEPDLVAVLIGSNDACQRSTAAMTPVEAFRESLRESLELLRSGSPQTRVLVGSVPDLEQVWRVGRNNPLAKQVWRLGICPSMLTRPASRAEADVNRRAAVSERVNEYNQVLEEVCAQYPMCRFDGGAVHSYRFTVDKLSPWDWFHPSVRGQAELARLLYDVAFGKE